MKLKNIAWNIGGLGVPLIVAALTIPSLIEMIGMERFGLLALAWGLIGFAGIFDLGIGRATTQTIAKLRGANQLEQVPVVLESATALSFRTGLIGAALLGVAVLLGAHTHIKYSENLNTEVMLAAYLLALAIPIQSVSAMFRGVNEAFENFREISLIRIGLGVANFLGPFCVAKYTTDLSVLVSTLLFSRIIAFILFRRFAKSCVARELSGKAEGGCESASPEITRQLLSFGGWYTVSCIVGPVLVQADRFFIGALISAGAIATYTIPYEVVIQCLIFVGAISGVAFPSLSGLVNSQPAKADEMFRLWLMRVAVMMFIITSLCALLLPVILPWWIGSGLPAESVLVGQILCIGVFFNSLGSMYFTLLHAYGRADITAKLHLFELLIYLFVLYYMIENFGVLGAALAWTGRVVLDTFLVWASYRLWFSSYARK